MLAVSRIDPASGEICDNPTYIILHTEILYKICCWQAGVFALDILRED